ncbi:MAG: DJ-1 family glyoxalase III [Fusobacteriaceae bacterium]
MNKIAVLLAEGFETIEALAPIDVFRRGGLEVTTVSITDNLQVTSSQKIEILADTIISKVDFSQYSLLVLPGGYPGYVNLNENSEVQEVIKNFILNNKYIGAICGGPSVLEKFEILEKNIFTCHHSLKKLTEHKNFRKENVIHSANLITSSGAGHSLDFGFELASLFLSEEKLLSIKKGMEL